MRKPRNREVSDTTRDTCLLGGRAGTPSRCLAPKSMHLTCTFHKALVVKGPAWGSQEGTLSSDSSFNKSNDYLPGKGWGRYTEDLCRVHAASRATSKVWTGPPGRWFSTVSRLGFCPWIPGTAGVTSWMSSLTTVPTPQKRRHTREITHPGRHGKKTGLVSAPRRPSWLRRRHQLAPRR